MKNFTALPRWTSLLFFVVISITVQAQQFQTEISSYLKEVQSKWELNDTDISNWMISDQYDNPSTGITYTYLHQQVAGIRIFGAVSSMAIREGQVVYFANRFIGNAAAKANASLPLLTQEAAIQATAQHLGLMLNEIPVFVSKEADLNKWTYEAYSIATQPIRVELVYLPVEHSFRLAWDVSIAVKGSVDWWNVRIDALTGAFLNKNNWTQYCDFGDGHNHGENTCQNQTQNQIQNQTQNQIENQIQNQAGNYNVFPLPLEAPSFGPRELLTDPNSTVASPFGWHDTNGAEGAEYTITRGNNVYAYEDGADSNQPGYSPDGGATLNFDFPLDLNQAPQANQDAIITNLFYVNNMVHDVLYHHGFDEASGNFQSNNYGNGGLGSDHVLAEAQDGGGNNNANFSTPADGSNGTMQMYLWAGGGASSLTVNAPAVIAGDYLSIGAAFGPAVTSPITNDVVLVQDGTAPVNDGCETILNAGALEGKIAVFDRGLCTFVAKVEAAQNAGAIAVIVINNVAGDPISMGGTANTTIPAVMISQADGALIKAQLAEGQSVNVTLNPPVGGGVDLDGSLDNGIVAHEYGHGLSIRLTGGPSNSNCLTNGEQGGEGWSDWLALILTIEPDDLGADSRGIGTYALGQTTTGGGIRRYPYSSDLAINPQTYNDLALSTEVHDVGEIWCMALWEMTWKLIEAEGFDQDLYNGTGGNNIAMHLVIEAMKLQPCNPGYVDGRDALLAADELLYGNAHRCLIWEAFTKRGLGLNAQQGSNNAGDETENFTLPTFCQTPVLPPVANFSANVTASCFGVFQFTDSSTDIPQQWDWDFGDGNTSTELNPQHTYANPGVYTVQLTVSNILGSDTYETTVEYTTTPVPVVTGITEICQGNATTLTADVASGNTAEWSVNGNVVFTGTQFATPVLNTNTTYSVEQVTNNPVDYVGPEDNTFGGGGNHNTGFEGKLLFEAFAPLTLKSVLVYAEGAANRTITLYNSSNVAIQTVNVFVPNGESRITLNFEIPSSGNYSIGNVSQNLYRNNAGADYPYEINGLVSIYSSNATTSASTFYYYFYDWEVQETPCRSEPTTTTVTVTPGPVASFATTTDQLNVTFADVSTGNPTNWSWNFGDGSPLATVQNPVHVFQQAGDYTVQLTVSDGNCSSTFTQIITVTSSNATGNPDKSIEVNVFPNPAGDVLNIDIKNITAGLIELKLLDAKGSVLSNGKYQYSQAPVSLNTGNFAEGIYFLHIVCEEGTLVRKVVLLR